MAPIKTRFADALATKIVTLPLFLRPQLAPILGELFDWVESVETRLAALDGQVRALNKMPSAATLALLNTPASPSADDLVERRFGPAKCGDCDE